VGKCKLKIEKDRIDSQWGHYSGSNLQFAFFNIEVYLKKTYS